MKALIIGCPGSGKSTFARKLQGVTGLPLCHLDMLFWNSDKTTVPRDVFDSRLEKVLAGDAWIIDGNYGRTMERRLKYCDTVFFLDLPTERCLANIRARRGAPRPDMPWVEQEPDAEFEFYVKKFYEKQRPQIIDLLQLHKNKNIYVFKSHEETDEYIKSLK
ncbi:MAG: adenylate kinase [Ruminococcaceae bacterium]|nr:adenylate kinase [Oscillospiraceae bacterium]